MLPIFFSSLSLFFNHLNNIFARHSRDEVKKRENRDSVISSKKKQTKNPVAKILSIKIFDFLMKMKCVMKEEEEEEKRREKKGGNAIPRSKMSHVGSKWEPKEQNILIPTFQWR